jgi:hypothetical protein
LPVRTQIVAPATGMARVAWCLPHVPSVAFEPTHLCCNADLARITAAQMVRAGFRRDSVSMTVEADRGLLAVLRFSASVHF